MVKNFAPAHTTAHELEFLEHLGRTGYSQISRGLLLQNYLTALDRRVTWGPLDPATVRKACEANISTIR